MRLDHETTNVEAAAYLARMDAYPDDPPDRSDYEDDREEFYDEDYPYDNERESLDACIDSGRYGD